MKAKRLSLTVTACLFFFATAFCPQAAMFQTAAQLAINDTAAPDGLDSPGAGSLQAMEAPATQRARFRITLTGFTCHRQTLDHMLGVDGWGDEVYFDSQIWTIERTRGVVSHKSRRSVVMGDTIVSNPPRIKAGTVSERGGIRTGDNVPGSTPWALSAAKGEDDRLPMLLWEGELVQGGDGRQENAAVIVPTIWEWDGFDHLARQWNSLVNTYFPANPNDPIDGPLISRGFSLGGRNGVYVDRAVRLTGAADRPIGFNGQFSSRDELVFTSQNLRLTYQNAQEAISRPHTNNGAGVVEIRYRESIDNTEGDYSLFLLIERLPDSSVKVAPQVAAAATDSVNGTAAAVAECKSTLRSGKVSWGGGANWASENIDRLCNGTKNAKKTIACFQSNVEALGWAAAIEKCK